MTPSNLPRLCFVHIPKTAGTTLNTILHEWYGVENTIDLKHYEHSNYTKADFERARLYHGHVHYSAWRQMLPPDTLYVTLLREPVQRSISHFKQIQRAARREIGRREAKKLGWGMDFARYVRDPRTEITNMQTRFIAAQYLVREIPKLNTYIQDELYASSQGVFPTANEAYETLKQFSLVGITEVFDLFIHQLADLVGRPVPEVRHQNVSPETILPTHADLGHITRRNEEDIKLYKMVYKGLYS